MIDLRQRIQQVFADKGRRDQLQAELTQVKGQLALLEQQRALVQDAQGLLQKASEATRASIQEKIELLVTKALRSIIPDRNLAFKVEYKLKGGTPEAHFFIQEDGELYDLDSVGGGLVGVVKLVLQIGFLLWVHPPVRRLLVLDEPLTHLSAEYLPNAAAFLRSIAEEFQVQIIMITHSERLSEGAHKVVSLGFRDGQTLVS